jgi:N-acetyl-1-D-myo-inositol-2-amino-2-deoxy-alpha-D-glucopyranoside deacetylase
MKKVLLVVVAHPDDESFGMGGTIALYSKEGVEVHLICATKGEAGEVPAQMLDGFSSIGELRESELRCAARELGLTQVHYLGYRDSGMAGSVDNNHAQSLVQAPVDEVAEKIALLIRKIKPQVVVTFDPIGGYMHPDHIAVHNACVAAFVMAGDNAIKLENSLPFAPSKLYFHIFPRGLLKYVVKLMPLFGKNPKKFGKNGDIDLASIMEQNFPTHARINYLKVAEQREKASACHASQGGDKQSGYFLTWILRLLSSNESFMRTIPPPVKGHLEKDLFEGI